MPDRSSWDTLVFKGGPRNVTTDLLPARRSGGFVGRFSLLSATTMPVDSPWLPYCVMNGARQRSVNTGYSGRPSWGSTTPRKPYVGWSASLPGRHVRPAAPKRQHPTTGLRAGPDVRWAVISGE